MKSFIVTLKTQKAIDMKADLSKKSKGVIIQVLDDHKIKYTFKKSLISKFIEVGSFTIMFSKLNLSEKDYEVKEC